MNISDGHVVREMEESASIEHVEKNKKMLGAVVIKFVGAFICLAVGVLSWILMAEALQGLFKKYPQPYFLAYWIHSFYVLLYVGWKTWREFPGNCRCNRSGDGALHWKTALWSSAIVGLVSLVSAYFWYLSLSRTSVPANTSVYQSAVAFVFILSVPILRERVTVVKVVAVIFAIGGVALISIFSEHDKSGPVKNTPLGYIYLIISTVLYAVLEVLYKKFASPKGDTAAVCNSFRFVGLMGVHSLLWMWPPIIILHFAVQPFVLPSLDVLKLMFLNAILDVIFNGAVFLCIALSSPLFASVGVITAIPTSVVVDFFVHKKTSGYQVYIGMLFIIIGFFGFCVSEFVNSKREEREKAFVKEGFVRSVESIQTKKPKMFRQQNNEESHILINTTIQAAEHSRVKVRTIFKYIL